MKKYTSRATKWLAILTLICVTILTVGIVFIIVGSPDIALQVGPTVFGTFATLLFLTCFFAEKSRTLVIDAEKIVFPRGTEKNGKRVFKKLFIRLDEISSLESRFHKGDKIISGDCFFHSLTLIDGTKVTVTLYAYGKEAEQEILETIQEKSAIK